LLAEEELVSREQLRLDEGVGGGGERDEACEDERGAHARRLARRLRRPQWDGPRIRANGQRSDANASAAVSTNFCGAMPTTSTGAIARTIVANRAGRREAGTISRSPSAMYICTSTPR